MEEIGSLEKQLAGKRVNLDPQVKGYIFFILTALIAFLILELVGRFEQNIYHIFSTKLYLTWHNIFEFSSCLISFCIFAITYYTYPWTGNKRSLFLGCVFLLVGAIDAFHAASYNGMPVFFTPSSAPKATMFWVIARLCFSLGLVISWFIPRKDLEKKISRWLLLGPTLVLAVFTLIMVSYYSHLLPPMYIEGVGLTKTKIYLEYFFIFLQFIGIVMFFQQYTVYREKIYVLFVSALIISIVSGLAFTLYKSVYDTYNLVGHLYKMVSYYLFFRLLFIYNVSRPYEELHKAQQEISQHAVNLERIVEQRTGKIMEMNEVLLSDLDYAKKIQQALLPAPYLKFEGVDFGAGYMSCQRVGGDFYNIFPLTDELVGMYLGDVAGHGVPAAMMTIFIYQAMEIEEFSKATCREILPNKVLQEVYRVYNDTDFPGDMYIVMLLATFNSRTGTLIYSSAGINTFPIVFGSKREKIFLEHKGFPLCKLGELHKPVYVNHELVLQPGEKVIFYTDGLTEAIGKNGEIFGEERLYALLQKGAGSSVKKLTETICQEVSDFVGDNQLSDDITFFILDYKGDQNLIIEKGRIK